MKTRRLAVFCVSLGLLVSGVSTSQAAPVPPPPGPALPPPPPEWVNPVPVVTGSAPSGSGAIGQPVDPNGGAPLATVGQVDPSTMDPTKVKDVSPSSAASAALHAGPKKERAVTPVSGGGDFDTDADPAAKAGDLVSVKLKGKRKGANKVGVKVDVLDEAETGKLGAQKLLVKLDRTDDGVETEDVEVALNYDSFRDSLGSDAVSRLQVVQLPACQGQSGCKDPVVVIPSNNNLATGVLTAKVSMKPKAVAPSAPSSIAAPIAAAAPLSTSAVSLATVAATSGAAGNYTSTPLTASTNWDVSGNNGAFNWSYPFTPVPATGPTPSMSLAYSSQMVDGLTANTNTQGGIAGPGWDLMGGGFIERSYRSCATDYQPLTGSTGDLCWVGFASPTTFVGDGQAGYSINLNGKVSPLIRKGTDFNFVLKDDPLWLVNDAPAGTAGAGSATTDNDGEHFTVKTPDGWIYEFGSDPVRNSVWAVPVFGNSPGEPCYNAVAASAYCYQGYRFMLDKVTDPFGNRMTYTYAIDNGVGSQQYVSGITNTALNYVRGGYTARIDYGYAPGAALTTPGPASMVFGYQKRCAPTATAVNSPVPPASPTAACDTLSAEPGGAVGSAAYNLATNQFPDVPLDLVCRFGLSCSAAVTAPVFFVTKRLASVSTFVGASTTAVDTWLVNHDWITADSNVGWKLWLRTVQRVTPVNSGTLGTSPQEELPYIYFNADFAGVPVGAAALANRVDSNPGAGVPAMTYWRLAQIVDEFGGRTEIGYGQQHRCVTSPTTPAPLPGDFLYANPVPDLSDYVGAPRDCYRVWYSNQGSPVGVGGFNKWFVKDVYVRDPVASNPDVHTHYDWGTSAWHRADADVVQTDANAKAEYSVFRGTDTVTVTVGDGTAGSPKKKATTTYFTGMTGDTCATSTPSCTGGKRVKTWPLAFGQGDTIAEADADVKAGRIRTVAQIDSAGTDQTRTYFHYDDSQAVVLNGFQDSRRVLQDRVQIWDNTFGTFQERRTDTHYNANAYADAVMEYASSSGSTANASGAARCTSTTYEVGTTTASGGTVPFRPISVKLFDGIAFPGACTGTQQAQTDTTYTLNSQPSAVTQYSAASTVASRVFSLYDTRGRVMQQSAPTTATALPTLATQKSLMSYTETGSLVSSMSTTDPTGHMTITDLDVKRAVPTRVVDVQNGNATTLIAYDGLGRRNGVLLPGNTDWANPNFRFSYSIPQPQAPGGYSLYTTTEQRESLGRYLFSRTFLDGMGRTRETQGRSPTVNTTLVNYNRYNDRGMAETETVPFPFGVTGGPTAATASPISGSAVPVPAGGNPLVSTVKTYDELGRPGWTRTYSNGTEKSAAYQLTSGSSQIDYPPIGQFRYKHFDAYGRLESSTEREFACCTGDVAMVRDANNVMVLFGTGGGLLWRTQQISSGNGQWTDWASMSTQSTDLQRVAATVRTNGRLAVVAQGSNGSLYVFSETAPGVWAAPVTVAGPSTASSDVAVVSLPSGVLRVFALTSTGVPQQFTETAIGGTSWTADGTVSNGGGTNTNLAAARFPDGRVALAARNTAGQVWVARQTAAGTGPLGGFVNAATGSVDDIDLALTPGGTLTLVGIGAGGSMYQRSETAADVWSAWSLVGTITGKSVAVDQYANGTVFSAVAYGATAWVPGSRGGTVKINTQDSPGGTFNSSFTEIVNDRTTSYTYDVRNGMTSMIDPLGNMTTNVFDWLGRKTSNHDPDMSSTSTSQTLYSYMTNNDGTSQQTVTDPIGTVIRTKSDVLGRPTFREKMSGASVVGTLAEFRYDNLTLAANSIGRLVSSSACSGTSTAACFGHASEIRTSVTGYDARGRTTSNQLSGTGLPATMTGPYNFATVYDDADHVQSRTYPTQTDAGGVAEIVNQTFDADGRPVTLSSTLVTYEGATSYYATGLIATRYLGTGAADNNGVQRWYTYDDQYRIQSLGGRRNTNATVNGLQFDSYGYDTGNNVTSIGHAETDGTDQGTECFRYDQHNRLTTAWTGVAGSTCTFGPGGVGGFYSTTGGVTTDGIYFGSNGQQVGGAAPYVKQIVYSANNNVLFQYSQAWAGGGTDAFAYSYPAQGANSVLPHAAIATKFRGTFAYNGNGSLIQRGISAASGLKQCLYWTPENRLDSITGNITTACVPGATMPTGASGDRYRYDANGQRVSRVTISGLTTQSTVYLGGIAEITVTNTPAATTRTKYYTSGGATVAMRKDGALRWLLADLQGGVALSVPNAYDGTASNLGGLQRQRYLPFGQRRGTTAGGPNDNITGTDRGFIGQVEDGTGLNYLNNRYYDPIISRFISVDPLVTVTGDAYGYAGNNPITMSDPSGLVADGGAGWKDHAASGIPGVPGPTIPDAVVAATNGLLNLAGSAAGGGTAENEALNILVHLWESSSAGTTGACGFGLFDCVPFSLSGHCEGAQGQAAQTVCSYYGGFNYGNSSTDYKLMVTGSLDAAMMVFIPRLGVAGGGGFEKGGLPAGYTSDYNDTSKGKKFRNIETNVRVGDFEQTLEERGYVKSFSGDGKIRFYEKDGGVYAVRDTSKTTGDPTAQFSPAGTDKVTIKIRLQP